MEPPVPQILVVCDKLDEKELPPEPIFAVQPAQTPHIPPILNMNFQFAPPDDGNL